MKGRVEDLLLWHPLATISTVLCHMKWSVPTPYSRDTWMRCSRSLSTALFYTPRTRPNIASISLRSSNGSWKLCLYLKVKKYTFYQTTIQVLGIQIRIHGIKIDEENVETVEAFHENILENTPNNPSCQPHILSIPIHKNLFIVEVVASSGSCNIVCHHPCAAFSKKTIPGGAELQYWEQRVTNHQIHPQRMETLAGEGSITNLFSTHHKTTRCLSSCYHPQNSGQCKRKWNCFILWSGTCRIPFFNLPWISFHVVTDFQSDWDHLIQAISDR